MAWRGRFLRALDALVDFHTGRRLDGGAVRELRARAPAAVERELGDLGLEPEVHAVAHARAVEVLEARRRVHVPAAVLVDGREGPEPLVDLVAIVVELGHGVTIDEREALACVGINQ